MYASFARVARTAKPSAAAVLSGHVRCIFDVWRMGLWTIAPAVKRATRSALCKSSPGKATTQAA